MEKFPAIFIDRDGTINLDGGYINDEQNFVLYPFAAQAIRMINTQKWLAIVVTNQSGIGRGFYTIEVMHRLHAKMTAELNAQGAHVDGIYYCPHDPSSKIEEYRKDCDCRKPKTGMLEQAIRDLALKGIAVDTSRMAIIGDKYSDMQAGFAMNGDNVSLNPQGINNCRTVMVNTGYGKGDLATKSQNWPRQPDYRAENLLEAVKILLKEL